MRYVIITPLMLATATLLGACQSPVEVSKDYMETCQWETRAKGTYTRSVDKIGANGLRVVVPAQGGDIRGALLINACIERHHVRAGTLPGVPEYVSN